jgi:hypothetical protein
MSRMLSVSSPGNAGKTVHPVKDGEDYAEHVQESVVPGSDLATNSMLEDISSFMALWLVDGAGGSAAIARSSWKVIIWSDRWIAVKA